MKKSKYINMLMFSGMLMSLPLNGYGSGDYKSSYVDSICQSIVELAPDVKSLINNGENIRFADMVELCELFGIDVDSELKYFRALLFSGSSNAFQSFTKILGNFREVDYLAAISFEKLITELGDHNKAKELKEKNERLWYILQITYSQREMAKRTPSEGEKRGRLDDVLPVCGNRGMDIDRELRCFREILQKRKRHSICAMKHFHPLVKLISLICQCLEMR